MIIYRFFCSWVVHRIATFPRTISFMKGIPGWCKLDSISASRRMTLILSSYTSRRRPKRNAVVNLLQIDDLRGVHIARGDLPAEPNFPKRTASQMPLQNVALLNSIQTSPYTLHSNALLWNERIRNAQSLWGILEDEGVGVRVLFVTGEDKRYAVTLAVKRRESSHML